MGKPARYSFDARPVAHPDAIVAGDKYRFTILTDGLLRFEWSEDGKFEDRASTFAINRELAVPDFYVWDRGHGIEVVTKRFHVTYDKKKFSAEGFKINLKGNVTGSWTYGQEISNLGGTTRTLDGVNGRTGLGPGVLSRDGIAVLDDSKSMLFESDGWIAGRRNEKDIDQYIFLYGRDYREAVRAYYALSGSQPLLPRFAMGNWWSRYHAYDEKEYLELHDHFEKDDVPMNVAVVDMDWHTVWNRPGGINGWTGYTWNRDLFPDPEGFFRGLVGDPTDPIVSDPETFSRLVPLIPSGVVTIAESGVSGPEDAAAYAEQGADAVLVGEALVRGADPAAAVRDIVAAGSVRTVGRP